MQARRTAEGERSQDEPGEDPLEDGATVLHTGRGAGRLRGPVHPRHAAGGEEGGELVLRQGEAFKTDSHIRVLFFIIILFIFKSPQLPINSSSLLRLSAGHGDAGGG